jgi:hypothetical protein
LINLDPLTLQSLLFGLRSIKHHCVSSAIRLPNSYPSLDGLIAGSRSVVLGQLVSASDNSSSRLKLFPPLGAVYWLQSAVRPLPGRAGLAAFGQRPPQFPFLRWAAPTEIDAFLAIPPWWFLDLPQAASTSISSQIPHFHPPLDRPLFLWLHSSSLPSIASLARCKLSASPPLGQVFFPSNRIGLDLPITLLWILDARTLLSRIYDGRNAYFAPSQPAAIVETQVRQTSVRLALLIFINHLQPQAAVLVLRKSSPAVSSESIAGDHSSMLARNTSTVLVVTKRITFFCFLLPSFTLSTHGNAVEEAPHQAAFHLRGFKRLTLGSSDRLDQTSTSYPAEPTLLELQHNPPRGLR